MNFRDKYESAAATNNSLLCVGLDPDPDQIPEGVDTVDFLKQIIAATSDLVCCYKPNVAFFEALGLDGFVRLREVIDAVPDGVPVLLDAKRGDVGHASNRYAKAVFEELGVDAVTVSPYLGEDALTPFFEYEDRHSFVLCRTSNPSAVDLQDLSAGEGGRPLYESVALLANAWNSRGNVGLVVGATYPEEGARIRELAPDLLQLMPGVGAQDADIAAAVQACTDAEGGGILINASRGVTYASDNPETFAAAARDAAGTLRDAINAAR
ncbi:MAG TPA: orotidine-5'-phosphate decarboxylase [Dehalococcoidia bacterium]|nr:orotidine-5'-phosphate decarboxylase [Dehalococcoidia bacterium]